MKLRSRSFIKYIALALVLVTLSLSAVSCAARPLAQTKLAGTEVGNVGKYSVEYEELYFLAHNYCEAIKDDYKNDPEGLEKAVWEYVEQNITTNYAILALCEKEGLAYDERELSKDVKKQIELTIDSAFGGSRSEYLKSQRAEGLTDHYVRFITGVDILYGQLKTKYLENGTVPNTDYALTDYIMNNFVHTWHVAILVDEGDDRDKELAKAEDILSKLDSGSSVYDLIKAGYSEDLTPDPSSAYYGHYFPKGIMNEDYERAAFSLKVGEYSNIVTTTAQNNSGQYVECFYIIERLPNNETEIKGNFDALCENVSSALVAEKMEEIKATLVFEENDFARSLDITALESVRNGADYQLILTVSLSVLGCAAILAAIIIIRRIRIKRFHSSIKK